VCDVLVMFCVVFFMLLCWKTFTCLEGHSVVGVAGEVSDLSRGAGLLHVVSLLEYNIFLNKLC